MKALLRRLAARIGNPLEWSNAGKCTGIAALLLVFLAYQEGAIRFAFDRLDIGPYIDRPALWKAVIVNRYLMGLWGLVLARGLLVRRHDPESRGLVLFTTQLYAVQTAWGAYFTGLYTFPWGTLLILTGGVAGFLLFKLRVVVGACVTGFALVVGATVAEARGLIPSAPFFRSAPPPYGGQGFSGDIVLWAPFLLSCEALLLFLYAYIIHRWRDREEKLKAAYADLREAKDALVRAESLAAVGSLVTGAAHELRNPLASSGALVQSLRDDIANSATISETEKQEAFQTIEMALKGQKRAALIAERLYSLTDALAPASERRPLGAVLDSLKTKYGSAAFTAGEAARAAPVNEKALLTVLANLLDNALAAGGSEAPSLHAAVKNSALEITVSDTGRGIPKSIQAEVFKPFFTSQKAGEGHGIGLGLYIVHELVSRMGGEVDLKSEEGKGTEVTLRVPFIP